MKAFLILEDGTVFTGTSIGSTKSVISEIVFNTSMTGYLEVLTDPSYAGQAVVMTYPLIGNYGVTPDMESAQPWPDGYIVRELSRIPSNFRCQGTIQDFLKEHDIPGIAGIDTRALTKILREKGTMNGMITTDENYKLDEILPQLHVYNTGNVVDKVTCCEKKVLKADGTENTGAVGTGNKIAVYANGTLVKQYDVVIYGDINGDGKISVVDLVMMQKQILGTSQLSGAYAAAADISRDGKVSVKDLVLLQKHIINAAQIEQ